MNEKDTEKYLTLFAKIKQLEEDMLYWKKAHIKLQNQHIRLQNKVCKK